MKLYAPSYYNEFKCIADRCRHSCCIGWEIGVDAETLRRYEKLSDAEREEICSHIKDGKIQLCEDGRCPFLDESGLCKIISRYGDAFTSKICREHPRFYNFLTDRAEVGLGASCPEAARIILSCENYDSIISIGNISAEPSEGYDAKDERKWIYSTLKDGRVPLENRFLAIMGRYCLSEELFLKERLSGILSELEYLREYDRKLFLSVLSSRIKASEERCERFFAYLVYRHLSEATSYESLRARLCMCLALTKLFESLCSTGVESAEAARLISEEIEYSEDNTDSIIFDFECEL